MKKKIFIFSSIALLSLSLVVGVTFLHLNNDQESVTASDIHTLTLDKSNFHNYYEYSPRTKSFNVNNFNNDVIKFNYKRLESFANGFAIMNPDSELYNPYFTDNSYFNGFDGIRSIIVNYSTNKGKLYLDYGLDEDYTSKGSYLESGVTYNFTSFRPSHFKLYASPNQVISDYKLEVSSIVITYSSYEYYTEGEMDYTSTKLGDNYGKKIIAPNGSATYNFTYDISNQNYLILKYSASKNLKGTIHYQKSGSSTIYDEEFYIEKADREFRTFLDNFRRGASGAFNKIITGITFYNFNDSSAVIYLDEIDIANRIYSRTDEKTISDSSIELGTSFKLGGSISSIRNLDQNIIEYLDKNWNVKIGSANTASNVKYTVATNPNLINIHDTGREIQQSYYFNVDSQNGYQREIYSGSPCSYNPVQAGDQHNNESKIIDYFATDTKIWFKVQACDWAHDNSLSKSYMTNTYEIKDGLIYVNNTFVNWSGFTNYDENLPTTDYASTSENPYFATQELPAVYVVHPLNYYGSYFGNKFIFDKDQGWNTSTTAIENDSTLVDSGDGSYHSSLTANSYHYSFRNHPLDWSGYFNEEKFGLAVYMPANKYYKNEGSMRHVFVSGNLYSSHNISLKNNRSYLDNYLNAQAPTELEIKLNQSKLEPSEIIDNTNYISTILGFYPKEYTTLNWTYVIGADYMDTMSAKFLELQNNNAIYNDFTVWKGALI